MESLASDRVSVAGVEVCQHLADSCEIVPTHVRRGLLRKLSSHSQDSQDATISLLKPFPNDVTMAKDSLRP